MVYDIIKEKNLGALYRQVNQALSDNFTPAGGIGYDGTWYFQAVVKTKEAFKKKLGVEK